LRAAGAGNAKSFKTHFSVNALNRIIKDGGKREALTLLTLTSLFEELDTKNSILEKYYECSFGEKK